MNWKVASAVSILLILAGCSLPSNFQWKFWVDESGSSQEEIIEEKDLNPKEQVLKEELVDESSSDVDATEDAVSTDTRTKLIKEENKTIIENGMIQNPNNLLVLVNKDLALPEDYVPKDLVSPMVPFIFEGEHDKRYIREEAARALELLFENANGAGIELYAVSGYRAFHTQESIYNGYLETLGEEKTNAVSAVPGHSEHQTGLAMDVTSRSVDLTLTEDFGETVEGIWLQENAHKFGFIIRYPKGKEAITGYQYEPWHLRYVGIEIATYIWEHELTLEEFFNYDSYQ